MTVAVTTAATAGAQLPQNPTKRAWIPLPPAVQGQIDSLANSAAGDIEVLEALVHSRVRIFYTTNGYLATTPSVELHSGRLRAVDIIPVPDLDTLATFLSDGSWDPGSSADWVIEDPVANWNQTHGPEIGATFGKRNPLVGMISVGPVLFVSGSSRNENVEDPQNAGQPTVHAWNGLSMLDGSAPPDAAFDPAGGSGQELWSFGTEGDSPGNRAVPEGSAILTVQPPLLGMGRWIVVGNYCGEDAAGIVLVLKISNLLNVDADDRVYLRLYDFLADWLDTNPPSFAPFGPEVARCYFTCPPDANGLPDCSSCPVNDDDISGNKIRPVLMVKVPPGGPNAGRTFLVVAMNLDPVELFGPTVNPAFPDIGVRLDLDGGRDDGNYDYLAIMDVTYMVARLPGNPNHPLYQDLWLYTNLNEWRAHTCFLRLPPDVPTGWTVASGVSALEPGDTWSMVDVPNPDLDAGETPNGQVRIMGSGTLKTMASDDSGRFLYVIGSDQGQESVAENALFLDGGYHVPHLYKIDLHAGDFTDQDWVNSYSDGVAQYRFNKVVQYEFSEDELGSVLVKSDLVDMPTADDPNDPDGPIGLTRVSGADLPDIGSDYPGEYQLDPTARTRMVSIRNTDFEFHANRLYIGTTGQFQVNNTNAKDGSLVGAVLVLSLDAGDGTPSYLRTLTLEQPLPAYTRPYQVAGVDHLPKAGGYVQPGLPARNVLAIIALNGVALGDFPTDRLVLIQDEQ